MNIPSQIIVFQTHQNQREIYRDDSDDDDEYAEEKEDEKPTVVVLRSGDLTAEEATKEEIELKKKEDQELIEKGKIVFKSQKKRTVPTEVPTSEPASEESHSNSKKTRRKETSTSTPSEDSKPSVKKPSLLSFEDEEDE